MILGLISAMALGLPWVAFGQSTTSSPTQFLRDQGYSGFYDAVDKAGLLPVIDEFLPFFKDKPLTAFVPNNAAFAAAQGALSGMTQAQLQRVVANHFVNDGIPASGISNGRRVPSLSPNSFLTFTVAGTNVSVNGATILKTDLRLLSSYIHEINQVMLPSDNPANAPLLINTTGMGTKPDSTTKPQSSPATALSFNVAAFAAVLLSIVILQ